MFLDGVTSTRVLLKFPVCSITIEQSKFNGLLRIHALNASDANFGIARSHNPKIHQFDDITSGLARVIAIEHLYSQRFSMFTWSIGLLM